MRTLSVHPTDSAADAHSLVRALAAATDGDVVSLMTGVYSPSRTGETLPIEVPAGVTVVGAGRGATVLDGEGLFEPSFNPIRTDLSVLVLGDRTLLSGLTVTNGGGHGVSVGPGTRASIHGCEISRHGQHGVFLAGVAEAVVSGNEFRQNGRRRSEPELPRGGKGHQGHHIFAVAMTGARNRLIITDNSMRDCWADGIGLVCFFDQGDGVTAHATILRNVIEESERGGFLFSASFGPSRNSFVLEAAHNVLRGNRQVGASVTVANPLAGPVPGGNSLALSLLDNEITDSPLGLRLQGGSSEARGNTGRVLVNGNRFARCPTGALHAVAGRATPTGTPSDNRLEVALLGNRFDDCGAPAVVLQAAAGGPAGAAEGNVLAVKMAGNLGLGSEAIQVCDGAPRNRVEIVPGSQAYGRAEGPLLT